MVIRRYLPGEEDEIRQVYFRATHESNARDYHPELLNRWAPVDQDMGLWAERLKEKNPLVALVDGRIVGMASEKERRRDRCVAAASGGGVTTGSSVVIVFKGMAGPMGLGVQGGGLGLAVMMSDAGPADFPDVVRRAPCVQLCLRFLDEVRGNLFRPGNPRNKDRGSAEGNRWADMKVKSVRTILILEDLPIFLAVSGSPNPLSIWIHFDLGKGTRPVIFAVHN